MEGKNVGRLRTPDTEVDYREWVKTVTPGWTERGTVEMRSG